MPKANDRIGPYQLINKLGKGAFGEVWLAKNVTALAAREIALKIPLDDEVDLEAIRAEAAIWIKASGHANVLPIIEANVYDNYVVIASEYAPGGSLEQWLKKYGGRAPSVEAAIEMTNGILAGLEYLHVRKIIHRDLKPANILLQGATPRIADFGISRVFKSTSQSAVMAGTPAYMAPEAFSRKRNEQTDLWSVGVILYQILAGRLPFVGQDMAEIMGAIINEEPEPLPASVPAWLRQVIAKALKKNPAERYKLATEMRTALSPSYREKIIVEPPMPKPLERPPINAGREKAIVEPPVPKPPVKPNIFVEDLGNGVKLELVAIPGGSFLMGSPESENGRSKDEGPQHRVTLPPFYIGKYQVTQEQYEAVMGKNPSYFKGARLPVEQASWNDAKEFCRRLSQRTGREYRLPSEAEWEYACRSGMMTPFAFGETISTDDVNYAGGLKKVVFGGKTVEVGSLGRANAWGLYDMHGNVWEWCEDVWHDNYNGAPTDGSAWLSGGDPNHRALRGGSWGDLGWLCRSSYRLRYASDPRNYNLGFRVVVSARSQ